MGTKEDEKRTDGASEEGKQSVADAAEAAGILGADASASGFASENQGETEVVQEATRSVHDGELAPLDADGNVRAFQEAGQAKEFVVDEQGRGSASAVSKVAINPSADYPGRDAALAATDGGRLMPGNLDAILRAKHAGTQMPGDAQLLSKDQIESLEQEFTSLEPTASTGEGTRFKEGDEDPNKFVHEKEVNPNVPTQERALKGVKA